MFHWKRLTLAKIYRIDINQVWKSQAESAVGNTASSGAQTFVPFSMPGAPV